jgi:ribosomal protein S12 methylthiotransferase
MKKTKVHIVSLGCPKNLVDSEVMAAGLVKGGYKITSREEEAEIVLINTCAFILPAKEESIGEIFRLAELKKTGACRRLVVTGCLPQRYGKALRRQIPEVDLFLGTGEAGRIAEHVKNMESAEIGEPSFLMNCSHERFLLTQPHFAYLKIAEGCSNRCAYCTIPAVRGKYRSRQPDDILAEAEALASKGVRELIVIAQDTTAYGSDLKSKPGLGPLLQAIARISEIRWIRLLYTHPHSLKTDLLETMAREDKICRYIDFPIQHIDDEILGSMNRKIGAQALRKKIGQARKLMPDAALRTSIIVGYPGETAEKFQALMKFVHETRFDHLGAFTYSREEGTPAARLPGQVPERVKRKRRDLLMEEQALISYEINRSLIGSVQDVIVEGDSDLPGYFAARARRQAPEIDGITYLKKRRGIRKGEIFSCRIVEATEYDLFGEPLRTDAS